MTFGEAKCAAGRGRMADANNRCYIQFQTLFITCFSVHGGTEKLIFHNMSFQSEDNLIFA